MFAYMQVNQLNYNTWVDNYTDYLFSFAYFYFDTLKIGNNSRDFVALGYVKNSYKYRPT